MQGLDDFVLCDVHDRFCLPAFIRNVELVKRRRVSASIRFGFGFQFFDHLHLLQINDADGVVARIRRVDFFELRHVLDPLGARCIGNCCHHFVRTEVNHIRLPSCQMSGNKVVIVRVDRQIIESFSARPWQIKLRGALEGLAEQIRRTKTAEQKKNAKSKSQRKQPRLHQVLPVMNYGEARRRRPRPLG